MLVKYTNQDGKAKWNKTEWKTNKQASKQTNKQTKIKPKKTKSKKQKQKQKTKQKTIGYYRLRVISITKKSITFISPHTCPGYNGD